MFFYVLIGLLLAVTLGALGEGPQPALSDAELSPEEAGELAREQLLLDRCFLEENPEDFQLSVEKVEEQPGVAPGHYVAAFTSQKDPEMAYYVLVPLQEGDFNPCGGGQLEDSPERLAGELRKNYQICAATRAWEKEHGPYCFWSHEVKAAFAAEYGSEPGDYRMESGLALPQATDVSRKEAEKRADAFLEKEFLLTPRQIAAMPKDVAFYRDHYTQNLGNTRCWLVLYRGELPREDGGYPLLYQVTVPSPMGETAGMRNFEEDTLMALGLSAKAASKLTELPTLFYIPGGGRFYHLIDDCASVPEKYLPMEEFDTGKLDQEPFEGLAPCPFCIQ